MAEAPCEVWFYHLERSGLDQVLPDLLEKTLARGWRALVRTADPLRIEHLDGWLWSFRDESFLPHGVAGEGHDAEQPVLITTAEANPNGANVLFLVDGAAPGELQGFARCVVLFDGRDEAALQAARTRWREIKAAGLPGAYWRQSERGSWEKQA
jgi:DNA polymerase III subunit chi